MAIRTAFSQAQCFDNHVMFLFVGPYQELVTLHTNLLPASAKAYIDHRCADQPVYVLEEFDAEFVQVYRRYLYTKQLFTKMDDDQDFPADGEGETHDDREWLRLARLHMLGNTVCDERFCNLIINAIIEKVEDSDGYPTGMATEVYNGTQKGDCLRKLIVDIHVWKGLGMGIREPHDDADGPTEFFWDFAVEKRQANGREHCADVKEPWQTDLCSKYHQHLDTTCPSR